MRNSIIIGSCKFFIVFFLLVIIGCSKSTNTTPAPTPPPDPPPTPTNPVLVVNRPDTAWYNGNVLVTFSATNANKITVDGVVVTTGQFLVQGITSPVELTIVASNETSYNSKKITVYSYSSVLTSLNAYGRWSVVKQEINGIETPQNGFCFHFTFYINKTVVFNGSACGSVDSSPAPYVLSADEKQITFGGHESTIESISSQEMILRWVNTSGQNVRWTLRH